MPVPWAYMQICLSVVWRESVWAGIHATRSLFREGLVTQVLQQIVLACWMTASPRGTSFQADFTSSDKWRHRYEGSSVLFQSRTALKGHFSSRWLLRSGEAAWLHSKMASSSAQFSLHPCPSTTVDFNDAPLSASLSVNSVSESAFRKTEPVAFTNNWGNLIKMGTV